MSISNSKPQARNLRIAIAMLCAGALGLHTAASQAAAADAATNTAAESTSGLDEIIVTGSRQGGIKAADSAAPIQILSAEALKAASGSPDLMTTLSQIVPSLTMQAFGSDMAGQTLQTKLRGLSPNHVLILINGKRRHTTANLAINPGSPYQGGANVDLNYIPVDAIDHIEVLTDGAAAQYGTDAIAGVINIILKKISSGGQVDGSYGRYMDGGGKTGDVGGNAGFEPMDGSYFTLTGEVRNHGHSNRGAIDERVVNPANQATFPGSNLPNVPGYPYVNQIMGDGEQHTKMAFLNTGFDFDGGTELYGVASYAHKDAQSFENYRMPYKVQYTDPLTGVTTYPFPLGFNPSEALGDDDYSLLAGVKGQYAGWNWDLSTTFGGDKVKEYTLNSANAGLYALVGASPNNFYDGSQQTTQWTSNIDFNRDFDVGLAGPLNVAFGGEFRRDTYAIAAGVPASYLDGGAQSFAGFAAATAVSAGRQNEAGYIDLAGKPIENLRVDAAARFEHYSDFGNATVGKLTARYDFSPEFALRGTISNGFRAPTLAEEHFSSTNVGPTTAYVQLPPDSAAGKLIGLGNGLDPEKSVNLSVGFVWRPTPNMSATLDAYQILVTNRIVGSGNVYGTVHGVPTPGAAAINAAIAATGAQLDPAVVATGTTGINLFSNGIDTKTRGVDLTFDFPYEYAFGKIDYTVGATINKTEITKLPLASPLLGGVPLYDLTAQSDLTTANPLYVINLGAAYTYGKVSITLLEKIYGASSEFDNDDGDNGAPGPYTVCSYGACTGNPSYLLTRIGVIPVTNLDFGFQLKEHLKLNVGALNLFDRYPNKINSTTLAHEDNFAYGDNAGVMQYPQFSPIGINGGYYYLKATFTF